MGDRANIAILPSWGETPPVVLYGHWSGGTYVEDARRALAKRWRWNDSTYLARIVFDEFVSSHGDETGYGITAGTLCDNEYPVLHLDAGTQRVFFDTELRSSTPDGAGITFDEFVAGKAPEELWRAFVLQREGQ